MKVDTAQPINERKVKDLTRPKRPLSAYNLFYRFKRQKVLNAISLGNVSKDVITSLVQAAPGMEDYDPAADDDDEATRSPRSLNEHRIKIIREDLKDNLLPRDTRARYHGKTEMNGTMSFLEMGTLMRSSWKYCDEVAQGVFRELAEEGREVYRQKMEVYNATKQVEVQAELLPIPRPPENHDKISTSPMPAKKKKEGEPAKKKDCLPKLASKKADDGSSRYGGGSVAAITSSSASSASETPSSSPPVFKQDTSYHGGINEEERKATEAATASSNHLRRLLSNYRSIQGPSQQLLPNYSSLSVPGMELPPNYSSLSAQGMGSLLNNAPPPPRVAGVHLQARVKELEDKLATERLKLRVRELETELARQRFVEDQLRSQVKLLSHDIATSMATSSASLVNNHHPSMLPSMSRHSPAEALAMLSTMAGTRAIPPPSSARIPPSSIRAVQGEHAAMTLKRMLSMTDGAHQNKKRRGV
ncbi:hypothetical protein ACHAXR_003166 [Thalassiosira sp. AJA248-18]